MTPEGRVVAFDPGEARIGVAVCDAGRTMAFPGDPVDAGDGAATRCAAVVREEGARVAVVGLPVRLSGEEGPGARAARALAAQLGSLLGDEVAVVLHDERFSTVLATSRLREAGHGSRSQRQRVDGGAAVILLESWLAR